ncbi:hypothetical protein ILYODFUR_021437 [Ilyodon furcidens]|uniref:Uncharacterized protein n=1 Tax=Ilyodon furcidens TaxID=33524 RepID=A0ABV0TPM4_9TELE
MHSLICIGQQTTPTERLKSNTDPYTDTLALENENTLINTEMIHWSFPTDFFTLSYEPKTNNKRFKCLQIKTSESHRICFIHIFQLKKHEDDSLSTNKKRPIPD